MKENALVTIAGKDIELIEYRNEPVITFKMMDDLHERPEGTAGRNFRENKDRFIENEDFFRVPYDEWQSLIIRNSSNQKDENQKNGHGGHRGEMIFLTQSGYLLVTKSLTDDLAWKVQRQLVKCYFALKRMKTDYSYTDAILTRERALRAEIRGVKADNAFTHLAEKEAAKIRKGLKSIDDLNGYPTLKERVENILKRTPEEVANTADSNFFLTLMRFVDNSGFRGIATELLIVLNMIASEAEKKSNGFPKTANRLSGELNRLLPFLKANGIEVQRKREITGGKERKVIIIRKVGDFKGEEP